MGIEWLKPGAFFGSILYALIGVVIFWLSFVIIDKITPYNLWEEIVEKQNVALGSWWRDGAGHLASSSPPRSTGSPWLIALEEAPAPRAPRRARSRSRCWPRCSWSRPAGWCTSSPRARWPRMCWATRSCSSPPSSAPTCSPWAWAPGCRASSSASCPRTSCASSCWSPWSAAALPALLFLANAYVPGAFRGLLYGLVLLVGTLVGLEIPLVMRILKRNVALKDLVSQVLTFDYLGALAVSVAFPAAAGAAAGAGAHRPAVRPDERGRRAVGAVAVPP